jgi:hypothetical protein
MRQNEIDTMPFDLNDLVEVRADLNSRTYAIKLLFANTLSDIFQISGEDFAEFRASVLAGARQKRGKVRGS